MSTVTLRWVEGSLMVGTDSTGHSVVIGKSPDDKSIFLGVKPSDLLLLAAASCSAYDVVEILNKQREPLLDLKISCEGQQKADPPYNFTRIHLHYRFVGEVSNEKIQKAIQLSEEKYCSVISSLRPGVQVTSDFEIVQL